MHEFETERLKMRLLQKEDKDFFVSLYTDPKIMRHIAEPFDFANAELTFERAMEFSTRDVFKQKVWAIVDLMTDKIIGIQSLSKHPTDKNSAIAGLILEQGYHCKGFAKESLIWMVFHGLNNLLFKVIHASCSVENKSAIKLVLSSEF
ncbi:GNAT family protein [Shewanella sp. 1_MG-2023]|uniref:GNAT family N-acetyltransferase n=1 Tax=unclassified Shewanella TaxID=196818 RepID=UPI0026E354F7|nr:MULTISPECIES: GNAT family protein [unclassified Shewanella]MDO6613826.1 GNAT family protein [Shewanella sp. 7_MG-2023]MDO6773576.1 GNAT family protein [Shewanella sp. 2_MG-2023]MDO6796433.1 GNAT family protein [Shewanella sp. 1_MG-2023]